MGENETNKLVVADVGWAETIPDWLKKAVEVERLVEGFANAAALTETNGGVGQVGLAETCVYLYTASLSHPLSHDCAQIYFWVTGKVMGKKGVEVPYFAREVLERGLDYDQQNQLDQLRQDLYRKRGGELRSPLFDALKALRKELKVG